MKYVLLFCGSDEDAAAFQAMTADERALGLTANPAERALLEQRLA